jgi:hypothetical protein
MFFVFFYVFLFAKGTFLTPEGALLEGCFVDEQRGGDGTNIGARREWGVLSRDDGCCVLVIFSCVARRRL